MSVANRKAKGTAKERASRDLFMADGWVVVRPGASLGAADLVCLKAGERPMAVQVKCNGKSPWMNFRPAERLALIEWAKMAGAVAVLAYWAPRARSHVLYEEWEWPGVG